MLKFEGKYLPKDESDQRRANYQGKDADVDHDVFADPFTTLPAQIFNAAAFVLQGQMFDGALHELFGLIERPALHDAEARAAVDAADVRLPAKCGLGLVPAASQRFAVSALRVGAMLVGFGNAEARLHQQLPGSG